MGCENGTAGVLVPATDAPTVAPTIATPAPTNAPTTLFDALRPFLGTLDDEDSEPLTPDDAQAGNAETEECFSLTVGQSCYETNGQGIEVNFRTCIPTDSDWLAVFDEEYLEWYPVGELAPDPRDAWFRFETSSCEDCGDAPMNNGTVWFGGGRLRMKEGDYRVHFVTQGITTAVSDLFEVTRGCD